MRKIVYGALAAVVIVGGCTAVSHLQVLQSRQIPPSPPLTIPEDVAIAAPAFQRGIDVDGYTYGKQNFTTAAADVVNYVKKLNANAIAISFPIFMSSRTSSRIFTTARTPSPAELSLMVADAERVGLYVSLRPLLSESHIGGNRTRWRPAHMSAWFASYQRLLLPYARMAQANKVGTFFVGAEFSQFGRSQFWRGLDRALRKVFRGRLAYANNTTRHLLGSSGGSGVVQTVDAYPPMKPPLVRGWESFDRQLPRGTVVSELSISAFSGAWRKPWEHKARNQPLDPQAQVSWFSAACQAAKATGLRGIYFWALPLGGKYPRTRPRTPGAWAFSAGANAITRCFGQFR